MEGRREGGGGGEWSISKRESESIRQEYYNTLLTNSITTARLKLTSAEQMTRKSREA